MVATLLMACSSGCVVAGIFRYLPVWQVLICCLGQGVAGLAWPVCGVTQGAWSEPGSRGGGGGAVDIYVTQNCRAIKCLLLFNSLSRRLMRFVFLLALYQLYFKSQIDGPCVCPYIFFSFFMFLIS